MRMACLDVVRALQAPYETSVSHLLNEYNLDTSNLLAAYAELEEILSGWGVKLEPDLGVGAPGDVRVLRSERHSEFRDLVVREISEGEGQRIEFKQTLGMDVNKNERGGKPTNECFSEDVVLSALKTIAGFLNSDGGTLLVGVRDDGSAVSIDREFICTCPKGNQSLDGWELRLRAFVEQYFGGGAAIQPYIQVGFAELDGAQVARVLVGARNRLSFISKSGTDTLYLRISNRTQMIPYREVEQYFNMSRRT